MNQRQFTGNAARWVFFAFFCLYLATGSGSHLRFGDGGNMLDIANHIATHGFGPMPLVENGVNKTKWGLGQILLDMFVVYSGHLFPAGPEWALTGLVTACALPAAIGASIPCLVFLISLRLRFRAQHALLAAFAVGLGSMTWVYSQTLFSEPLVSLCWMLATYALISFDQSGKRSWLLLAGLAGGYGVITKATCLVALPLMVLYWVVSSFQRSSIDSLSAVQKQASMLVREGALLIAPMLFFCGVSLWYNWVRFGNPLESGYSIERDGQFGFNTALLSGLFGLTLSTGKGFFFYNPMAILGLLGLREMLRTRLRESLLLLGFICITVLAHSRWWAWHGDCAWGPRFLVPLTPCFALLSLGWFRSVLDDSLSRFRSIRLSLVAGLFALAIGIQCLGLCFPPMPFIDLVAGETKGLIGGPYDSEKRPTRDDVLAAHFIPEFSPIAGHFWMLRAALAGNPSKRAEIMLAPPWRALNPLRVRPSLVGFGTKIEIWWIAGLRGSAQHPGLIASFVCLLFLSFAIGSRRAANAVARSAT